MKHMAMVAIALFILGGVMATLSPGSDSGYVEISRDPGGGGRGSK